MEEKTVDNSKKITIIYSIGLIGIVLGLIISIFMNESFFFYKSDRFKDYFNTLEVSKDVYSSVGTGRGYFPFTYILLNIIDFIIADELLGFIITFILSCVVIIIFYTIFLKKWDFLKILVIVLMSYPMIFTLDRGNIEYLVLAFLLIFFICYKKEMYKTAAVLLAFPICMKLYPAVFILLFFRKKKIKEFFICSLTSIIIMISSYYLLGGTINTIPTAIENFGFFTDSYAKTVMGVQFSHSMWSGLNYLSLIVSGSLVNASQITIYTIVIAIIAVLLSLYIILFEKEEWKAITILTIMMISFPHVSFDYTLIHLFIPIAFFIMSKNTSKTEGIAFSILLALSIIPMNWFQTVINGVVLNVGLMLRPIIFMSIILIIVITTIKKAKLRKA